MIDLNDLIITGSTATTISTEREIPHNRSYSIQVIWSGSSIVGNVYIQASLDGTNYSTIPDSTQSFSGNSGNFIWDITEANYNWINVVCNATTGTVTFRVYLQMKRESKIG